MFSALSQGSLLHIIDKTKVPKYIIGNVIKATQPVVDYNDTSFSTGGIAQSYLDVTVSTEDGEFTFKHIPSNQSLVYYNNGNIVISETKEGLINDVEAIHKNAKNIIDNKEFYEECITACDDILPKLSVRIAKDKEYDTKFKNIDNRITGLDDKLDKVLNILNNK